MEKAKQQEQEQRRKAMNDVEKQVSMCDCVRGLFLSSMSPMKVQVAILIETWDPFPDHSLNKQSQT